MKQHLVLSALLLVNSNIFGSESAMTMVKEETAVTPPGYLESAIDHSTWMEKRKQLPVTVRLADVREVVMSLLQHPIDNEGVASAFRSRFARSIEFK